MPTKRMRGTERVEPLFSEQGRARLRGDSRARVSRIYSTARFTMPVRTSSSGNEYRCAIEVNQNGKYNVRILARFGGRDWTLPVYFLASSFSRAMKRLEEALQFLQRNEEKIRFWGRERSDDPNMASDLLKELGLKLDRRMEFPRKAAGLGVAKAKPVPAVLLAPVRRALAEAVAESRATAGD